MEGGLGNQLLQYLFGLSVSHMHDTPVYFDISEYVEGRGVRKFALDKLQLPGTFFSCRKRSLYDKGPKIELTRFAAYPSKAKPFPQKKITLDVIEEPGTNFSSTFYPSSSGYFEGYWGSYLYWQPRNKLINWLNTHLDNQSDARNIKLRFPFAITAHDCALHVRRGDYLKPENAEWHGLCSPTYFKQAIQEQDSCRNFFFSDDVDYLSENFADVPNFVDASSLIKDEIDEFLIFRKFSKIVISNSSYSYLAGLLGALNTEGSKVICPHPWFKFNLEHPDFPPKWISRNRLTGATSQAEYILIERSSVGVLIDHFNDCNIDDLRIAIDAAHNQTHSPLSILLRTQLSQHSADHLLTTFPKLQILYFPGTSEAEYATLDSFKDSCDYIFFMQPNERWEEGRIYNGIKTFIQTNADVVTSDLIRLNNATDQNNSFAPFQPKVCNSNVLFQRSRLNVLFDMAAVACRSNTLNTAQLMGSSSRLNIVFSDRAVALDAIDITVATSKAGGYDSERIRTICHFLLNSSVHDSPAAQAFYRFFSQDSGLTTHLKDLMRVDETIEPSPSSSSLGGFRLSMRRLLSISKSIVGRLMLR